MHTFAFPMRPTTYEKHTFFDRVGSFAFLDALGIKCVSFFKGVSTFLQISMFFDFDVCVLRIYNCVILSMAF